MYGHGYPPYPPPPPPPRSTGLSPLTIALIVVGGVAVLGGGACVVLGGLMVLGANAGSIGPAKETAPVASADSHAAPNATATPAPPVTATSDLAPLPDAPESVDQGSGHDGDDDHDEQGPSAAAASTGKGVSGKTSPASAPAAAAGTKWFCNATGWVRVCGFANVCSNQMVSGIGSGSDRFLASNSAKIACEGMARAKGGSTVCSVSCTLR